VNFYLNPTVFGAAFSVPSLIADNFLKLATHNELKVILYVLRHSSDGVDIQKTANALNLNPSDVEDALCFWVDRGVLISDKVNDAKKEEPKIAVEINEKPSRVDVAKRGLEDENIAHLLQIAQLKFGRNLKTNESSTLVYIYDDLGLQLSLIFLLFQYALDEGKLNIRFIEKTAVEWVNAGVKTVLDAEKIIEKKALLKLAWKRVERVFGIEDRKPSTKETELSVLWLDTYKLDEEYLSLAYNVCVDNRGKLNFAYIAKVIENWRKENLDTAQKVKEYLADNTNKGNKKETHSFAGYDLEAYEKSLDEDD